MKIITQYGVTSKNTPIDTYDSILLAINTEYVDGVQLNMNMTKDGKIIIYQSDFIENNPKYKISNLTYPELLKHNLGSKVKKHYILTLEDALKLFENTSKLLILNANNQQNLNIDFMNQVQNLINQYPNDNVYIQSSCKEIVSHMMNHCKKAKIGAFIIDLEPYFWDLNLDFYSISVQKTKINECSKRIQTKLQDNRFIMMGDIADSKTFQEVKKTVGDEVFNKSYIITSNIVGIAPYINPN